MGTKYGRYGFNVKKVKDNASVLRVLEYSRFNNEKKEGKKVRKDKVEYYGGKGVNIDNLKEAVEEFRDVRRIYNKDKGVLAYHITITFQRSYAARQIDRCAKKFCKEVFGDYQYVYGVHDLSKSHVHLVINSVNYKTGYKYRSPFPTNGEKYKQWLAEMQRKMDEVFRGE